MLVDDAIKQQIAREAAEKFSNWADWMSADVPPMSAVVKTELARIVLAALDEYQAVSSANSELQAEGENQNSPPSHPSVDAPEE